MWAIVSFPGSLCGPQSHSQGAYVGHSLIPRQLMWATVSYPYLTICGPQSHSHASQFMWATVSFPCLTIYVGHSLILMPHNLCGPQSHSHASQFVGQSLIPMPLPCKSLFFFLVGQE